MKKHTDLKPCPFCNKADSAQLVTVYNLWEEPFYSVKCQYGCCKLTKEYRYKGKAINKWNNRGVDDDNKRSK